MKKIMTALAVLLVGAMQALAVGTAQADFEQISLDVGATFTDLIPYAVGILVVFLGWRYGKKLLGIIVGR